MNNFVNPMMGTPENIVHGTFYSKLVNQKIGYNIYLPSDYENSDKRYPVVYHLHGWKSNESSDIWTLEKVYKNKQFIMVFANDTADYAYRDTALPVESIIINDLIPFIDANYKTDATREGRSISGWSMGGGRAFHHAVKYPELFSVVTAYGGTYHHFLHKDFRVGEPPEKAAVLYESMMKDAKYFEKDSILYLVKQNAEKIRGNLCINIHIGTADILFCENKIMHLYLESLSVPHEYKEYDGVAHELDKVI